jgi:dTDP-4-amino-4,6-dideoxygalactose transaminase
VTLPPADPGAGYAAHRTEIDEAIRKVLEGGRYILGEEVEAFEREFAAFVSAGHAIGAGSGTEALHLALRACGVERGDTVATVSHTAVATVAAIELAGAKPLLVDVDASTFTMDPDHLQQALERLSSRGQRAKALIPVHLYGLPCDMPRIMEIARIHGARVVEDCAQSHGAAIGARMTGTWGDAAAFSFYPTKNLGAFGDGGAVVTSDPQVASRAQLLRQYGWRRRYVSEVAGWNSRLDEMQASILRVEAAPPGGGKRSPPRDRRTLRRKARRGADIAAERAGGLRPCLSSVRRRDNGP